MRSLLLLAVVSLASCRGSAPSLSAELSDQLIIDCVGTWTANKVRLKLWGDHPDYDPDAGEVWREGKKPAKLRYIVQGTQMHLWIDHGRVRQTTDFQLVRKDAGRVLHFELRFKGPVLGEKVYTGSMPTSYRCEPRGD